MPNDLRRDQSLAGAIEKEIKSPEQKQEEKKTEQTTSKATPKPPSDLEEAHSAKSAVGGEKAQTLSASPTRPTETPQTPTQGPSTKPLDTVLNRSEPPTSATPSEQKPPHLQASRYVHHFDTYTISRDLQKGGFTQAQSVTLMKAVRGLLSQNLDVAHDGLVSKSDMENVCAPFPRFPLKPPNNRRGQ